MAEEQQGKRERHAKAAWYAVPGVVLVGFVVWILAKMGEQSTGVTLGRLLIGLVVILGASALGYWLMSARSRD